MVKITVDIEGMACGMCEAHIDEAVGNAFQVKKVTSSHTKKRTVILTEKDILEQELKNAVAKAGYDASEGFERVCGGICASAFAVPFKFCGRSHDLCSGGGADPGNVGGETLQPGGTALFAAGFTVMMALDVALG